jgi:ATP synthase protein I
MNDPDDGQRTGPIGEDRRLNSLDERLERLEASEAERLGSGKPASADANYRMGNRVLADLIGGIAGGALIGWLIDRLAGTWPWGFMIFLFLGIIVAFRNIFRLANQASRDSGNAGGEG